MTMFVSEKQSQISASHKNISYNSKNNKSKRKCQKREIAAQNTFAFNVYNVIKRNSDQLK